MKVELKLDPECRETSVLVRTDRMTEDTERLLRKLRAWSEPMLLGFRGEAVSPLDEASISRIYAQQGRVCAVTDVGEFRTGRGSTSWRRDSRARVGQISNSS